MFKKRKIILDYSTIEHQHHEELYSAWYECPRCDEKYIPIDAKFCPGCGRKIKWLNK